MKERDVTLLLRSFDEQLDEEERTRLDELLDQEPDLRAERARLAHLRALVASSRSEAFEAGFADRVLRRLPPARPEARRSWVRQWLEQLDLTFASWRPVAIGAAAVALAAVGLVLWMRPHTVAVPNGAQEVVHLSDGSTVELSGGSAITYRRFAGRSTRMVELEGEAYFDVASDERPFVVETFNASIRVLGTRFNVRAWPEDPHPETEVVLAEGRVEIARRPRASAPNRTLSLQSLDEPILLRPGQMTAVSDDSTTAPRSVALDRILAWRAGGFAAADRPLAGVFRDVERRYGVRVTATDPRILDRTVTYLNPAPASAADVLADICYTLDLRYRRIAGGFEVLAAD